MHPIKYSLLIPVRNEARRIVEVLTAAFADLGSRPDWEVCVADDFSDDGTYARLQELAASLPFRLLRPEKNLGRGPIRNWLAEQARGDILIFLDGDCLPLPGFFQAWENLDPDAVYIGKVGYESSPPNGFSRFMSEGAGVNKLRDKAEIPAAYFVSQNFRIAAQQFRKIGGFRADLRGWGGEDTDFGVKLKRLSLPLRFRREAMVCHPIIADLGGYLERLDHFGRENLPVLIADNPEFARQFKLGAARFPYSIFFLNYPLFRLCRFLVTSIPSWTWPFPMYRYVIFNAYARGFRQFTGPLSGPR